MTGFNILQSFSIVYVLQGMMLYHLTLQNTAAVFATTTSESLILNPSTSESVAAATTTTNEERVVFVSSTTQIYLSKGPDYNFNPLPFDVGRPGGIDFDEDTGVLFWTDSSAEAIKRTGIDDPDYTTVLTSAGTNVAAIAVDGNEDLIFWVNTRSYPSRRIERVTYKGKERTEVYTSSSSDITSITLYEKTRTLYWAEGSYIGSCSYDGRNRETIVTTYNAPDITINIYGSQVFWCSHASLKTVDLTRRAEGSSNVKILSSTCTGVTWFEGHLYWTSGNRLYLSVRDLDTGTNIVRGSPIISSSLTSKDIIVGRRKLPGLDGGTCDFERFKCKWAFRNSMSNNLNWTRWTGELSANSSIGPTIDHSIQTQAGHFLFLNTSNHVHSPGNIATLISPAVNVSGSGTKCFRLWYYMHDVINGSLTVFFQSELNGTGSLNGPSASKTKLSPLWSMYGSQSDEWIGAEMEVRGSGVGRILIRAIVGDPMLNAIAIDDVHLGECRQDSRLVCEDTSMTVYLDKARLGISSQDGVSFKNSLCQGAEYDSDTIAIRTPYNGCGTSVIADNSELSILAPNASYYELLERGDVVEPTSVPFVEMLSIFHDGGFDSHVTNCWDQESDDVIVFSNQVNVMIHSDTRTSDVSVRVNCSLSRTYHVAMTYLAHAWISYIRKDGYGNFTVGIRQYTNATFEEAYPSESFPQQVEIDDKIYMATEMVAIENVVETIQNSRCWATPSQDPSDPVSRDIIRNGCPVGDSTKVYTLLTQGLQAFSFKAFSFSQDKNLIYVHCDLIICHESSESACSSNCSHSRAVRETRDARDVSTGPYTVSRGPFTYKMHVSRREDGSPVNVILLSALVCTIALLFATIFVAVFIYARFRNGGIRHD